jgi:hypothetical protein
VISSDDLTQMQADLQAVRDDNPVSITIRRGSSELAAQTVRVARIGGQALVSTGTGTQESKSRVIVVGSTSLDIQPGDRFTVASRLYEVNFIRPNRTVATVAEAYAVE